MRIAIGNNHRGYRAKQELASLLKKAGHEVEDLGSHDFTPVDYPDVARTVCEVVVRGGCDIGILIGGNGMGFCMAANKVHGVRAAVAADEFAARCVREKYHCNVLCLGAELGDGKELERIVEAFVSTSPGAGKHARMVEKMMQMESADWNEAVWK